MSNWEQIKQNINKFRQQISVHVFLAGMILSIMFFLLFINAFSTHTAKVEILFNAKSETAALQSRQILDNLVALPKTLFFYDRLLKYNKDVRDIAAGENPVQRKKVWNEFITIRKIGKNSSIFEIAITTKLESDANQLAQKTVRNLFDTASFYYDIKNDIDLRVVDGPIVEKNVFSGWFKALILSIVFGFLTAFILQSIINNSKKLFSNGRQIFGGKSWFDFGKKTAESSEEEKKYLESLYISEQMRMQLGFQKKKEEEKKQKSAEFREMKKLTKMLEPDKYPNFREVPKTSQAKSSAPANLPIAEDTLFFNEPPEETAQKDEQKEYPEPSEEQFKERLNKLLKGELK